MHIISITPIIKFNQKHTESENAINEWYKIVKTQNFENLNELRRLFPSADIVKNKKGKTLTIFNIHGNKIRLIAAIHYNRKKLYIRHILTHPEYDKEKWKS